MYKLRIAINGFGRIGRIFFRQAFGYPEIEIVAINDLGSIENLAYLLKYDTVYGRFDKSVELKDNSLLADGQEIKVFQEIDPKNLPWKDLNIDVVVESTGVFETKEKASGHLEAGAKRVVITAPAKDEITPTATPNVGMQTLADDLVTSNASCTTNAVNPVAAVMMASVGLKKAILTTVHGYTASQGLVDGPDKKEDFRRARAAAQNIVPSTTGAAKATIRVINELENKFDGVAIRVPVLSGSLIDFTFVTERPTSVKEINDIFKKAAASKEWEGILTVTEDPIVSSDILGNPHGSVVDLALTKVIDGDLAKVFAWYDNEWGYGAMLLKHLLALKSLL
ncbi:MAG: type I glyceraldehyde-3-phosphate dehydrogenase [Candidatus Yanofskybacteria bacterium RIFCSPHIGHO2_02_FULL_43_15c]|uniref:Type I glyceraldehyde-3-phosphate dehydrogenase n=1 Tax=Candidatus Yanofskybacteria bacterium RIFCSPHIGHO2_02_FULL_43_15c TaxID=1802679 RepID=A0A1F8FJ94_9BACT|nr:MAG: type I glyceraldehyde-3-phosphate dehydrogenase [Candidatus Yanofskybacteria bacterium RIFCSPHIGHO2_02_FULL_43_15c]